MTGQAGMDNSAAVPWSRLYLPTIAPVPATVLDYLLERFPGISRRQWCERMAKGLVFLDDGTGVLPGSPYRAGQTVRYRKQIPLEPKAIDDVIIVHQDASIVVVDKPHGMPVTPAGDYVERSLLVQLRRMTGIASLTPMHRLDRDTAGLVLFSVNAAMRKPYHALFANGAVQKEYVAISRVATTPANTEWLVENRIERGDPWHRQQIIDGPPNARSMILLLEVRSGFGLFRLLALTGKKHQLRLHMASLGFPILDDCLYPDLRSSAPALPLQLLAQRLAFLDPLTGAALEFSSTRRLAWPASLTGGQG
jgi:tRNA pseudouridine32 synthase/23S rRNA pseudouridine746 synthase